MEEFPNQDFINKLEFQSLYIQTEKSYMGLPRLAVIIYNDFTDSIYNDRFLIWSITYTYTV